MSGLIVLGLMFLLTGVLNTLIWRSLFKAWGRSGYQGALPIAIQTTLLALGIGFLNMDQYGGFIFMFCNVAAFFVATPKIVPIALGELAAGNIALNARIELFLWWSCRPMLGLPFSLLLLRELSKHQQLHNDDPQSGRPVDDSKEHL